MLRWNSNRPATVCPKPGPRIPAAPFFRQLTAKEDSVCAGWQRGLSQASNHPTTMTRRHPTAVLGPATALILALLVPSAVAQSFDVAKVTQTNYTITSQWGGNTPGLCGSLTVRNPGNNPSSTWSGEFSVAGAKGGPWAAAATARQPPCIIFATRPEGLPALVCNQPLPMIGAPCAVTSGPNGPGVPTLQSPQFWTFEPTDPGESHHTAPTAVCMAPPAP